MATLEIAENDPVQQCMSQKCQQYLQPCEADQTCVKAATCMKNCGAGNFACSAKCLADNNTDAPLIQLLHCQVECLGSFVDSRDLMDLLNVRDMENDVIDIIREIII